MVKDRIRQERLRLGMTQTEFARALGLKSNQPVSNWERGVWLPSGSSLSNLAQVTGKPAGYFLASPGLGDRPKDYAISRRYAAELQRAVGVIERVAAATGASGHDWEAFVQVLEMSAAAEEFKAQGLDELPQEETRDAG